jgi:hypothetical protein
MAKVQRAQTRAASKRDAGTSVTVAPAAGMDRIAQRAYEIWKQSGCPDGHDQEHWFQAERELRGGAPRR